MEMTQEDRELLTRAARNATPARLNEQLSEIDRLTARFPNAMPEFFAAARGIVTTECERRNRLDALTWEMFRISQRQNQLSTRSAEYRRLKREYSALFWEQGALKEAIR